MVKREFEDLEVGGDLSGITEAWKEISRKTKICVIVIFTTPYRFKTFVSLEK